MNISEVFMIEMQRLMAGKEWMLKRNFSFRQHAVVDLCNFVGNIGISDYVPCFSRKQKSHFLQILYLEAK